MGSTNFCGIIKFRKNRNNHSFSLIESISSLKEKTTAYYNKTNINKKYSLEDKYASIELTEDKNGDLIYVLRENLFKTQTLQKIQEQYHISEKNLQNLWSYFKKIDKNRKGFIKLTDLYDYLEINQTSFISPFLDRFYINIEKEFQDKILFEEFLPKLISFCLFSPYKIIEFVFNMIDKNHDGFVKKLDIIKFVSIKRDSEGVYLTNNIKAINDYARYKRGDKISKEDFMEMCLNLNFIFFPAVCLQEIFREKFAGENFWKKMHKEIKIYALNQAKINDKKRIEKQIEKVKDKVFDEKRENFLKRIEAEENLEKMNKDKFYKMNLRIERKKSDTLFYMDKIKNEKSSIKELKEDLEKKRKEKLALSQVLV